jgi:hypothetical protein
MENGKASDPEVFNLPSTIYHLPFSISPHRLLRSSLRRNSAA